MPLIPHRPVRLAVAALLLSGALDPVWAAPGDPPMRVGRVAKLEGTASFRIDANGVWEPASVNRPVANGNSVWADADGQAWIDLPGTRLALAGRTELDVVTLDIATSTLSEPLGELYVRTVPGAARDLQVQTPRGVIAVSGPARIDIVAGTDTEPTLVSVQDGAVRIVGDGFSTDVSAGHTASIGGAGPFAIQVGALQADPFFTAMLAADRPAPPRIVLPQAVAGMAGTEDLAAYGDWQQNPQYGAIWYPQVASGWAPYRQGRWVWAQPWGWTWVDQQPWGFAPSHYGRWAQIDDRWAWIPVYAAQPEAVPVYSPAVVGFFGVGAIGLAAGAALAAGDIGWVPLGPREPYLPPYRASPGYIRALNPGVININNFYDHTTINQFANRSAAVTAPEAVFAGSQPVASAVRAAPAGSLTATHAMIGRDPVRPTLATAGITSAVAHSLHLADPTTPARPAAPGPVGVPHTFAHGPLGLPNRMADHANTTLTAGPVHSFARSAPAEPVVTRPDHAAARPMPNLPMRQAERGTLSGAPHAPAIDAPVLGHEVPGFHVGHTDRPLPAVQFGQTAGRPAEHLQATPRMPQVQAPNPVAAPPARFEQRMQRPPTQPPQPAPQPSRMRVEQPPQAEQRRPQAALPMQARPQSPQPVAPQPVAPRPAMPPHMPQGAGEARQRPFP